MELAAFVLASTFLATVIGQSPIEAGVQALQESDCPTACRYPTGDAAQRAQKPQGVFQPRLLSPWLASARAVNQRNVSHVSWGPDLQKSIVALRKFTGLRVECSPALLEFSRGEGRAPWSEGGAEGWIRGVELLASLRRTRFHPGWILDEGVLTLVTEAELETAARAADSDPRNEELAALRARVRVHWDAPELHVWSWQPEDGVARERTLFLSGSLGFVGDKGTEQELTWPLSVCVLVTRRPQAAPDWSSDIPGENTCAMWTTCEAGRFSVHIQPAELERVPGEVCDFTIGLCLPDLEPGGTWRRMSRVLPQSVKTTPIPGPLPLGEDLQLINACVANDALQYDPIAYVRVVNHLRRLGKARALERLREYSRIVPSNGFITQSPIAANADHGNAACVFWIVRLLFDFDRAAFDAVARGGPNDEGVDRARALNGFAMSTGMVASWAYRAPSYPGDRYPFVVVDGLPFFAPEWLRWRTGYDPTPLEAIEWAEVHGTVRGTDLVPTDDPIATVETLEQRVGPLPECNKPRQQVLRALGPLVGIVPQLEDFGWYLDDGNRFVLYDPCRSRVDADLSELKQALAPHGGVHWDAGAQRYVLGPREH
jgi:hypothetical protein